MNETNCFKTKNLVYLHFISLECVVYLHHTMNILVNFLLNNEDTMLDIVVQICILHSLKYNY